MNKERLIELLQQLAMGRRAAAEEIADMLCGESDVQSPDKVYGRVVEVPVVDTPPKKKAK